MNIEHFVFLSCFSARPESHEQDGERLSRASAKRKATASGDPAMASNLAWAQGRSISDLARLPAALSPPAQIGACDSWRLV
jgi:hypothetical protein